MNREIEFRGKTKDNEWIYGYYHKETSTSLALQEYGIGEINTHYIHTVINHLPFKVEVTGETIGQYSGLKDCNGVKIFEGDILREYSNDIEDWVVSYEYGKFVGTFDNVCEDLYELSDLEVIGNIYENDLESKGE